MTEYIEREALKDAFWSACKNCLSEDDIADLIDDAPAADVAPVVHGRWVERIGRAECSVCHDECWALSALSYNYCPNCGAKMGE